MNELELFHQRCLAWAQPLGLSCEVGETVRKNLGNTPLEPFYNVQWRPEAVGQVPLRAWVNVATNDEESVSFTFDGRSKGKISFGDRQLPDGAENVVRGLPL